MKRFGGSVPRKPYALLSSGCRRRARSLASVVLGFSWNLSGDSVGAIDFLQNVFGLGCPDEGLGVVVMHGDIFLDGADSSYRWRSCSKLDAACVAPRVIEAAAALGRQASIGLLKRTCVSPPTMAISSILLRPAPREPRAADRPEATPEAERDFARSVYACNWHSGLGTSPCSISRSTASSSRSVYAMAHGVKAVFRATVMQRRPDSE